MLPYREKGAVVVSVDRRFGGGKGKVSQVFFFALLFLPKLLLGQNFILVGDAPGAVPVVDVVVTVPLMPDDLAGAFAFLLQWAAVVLFFIG